MSRDSVKVLGRTLVFISAFFGLWTLILIVCFAFDWQPWRPLGWRTKDNIDSANFIAELLSLVVEGTLFAVVLGYLVPQRLKVLEIRRENERYSGMRKRLCHELLTTGSTISNSASEYFCQCFEIETFYQVFEANGLASVRKIVQPDDRFLIIDTRLNTHDESSEISNLEGLDDFFSIGSKVVSQTSNLISHTVQKCVDNFEKYGFIYTPSMVDYVSHLQNLADSIERILSLSYIEKNSAENEVTFIGMSKVTVYYGVSTSYLADTLRSDPAYSYFREFQKDLDPKDRKSFEDTTLGANILSPYDYKNLRDAYRKTSSSNKNIEKRQGETDQPFNLKPVEAIEMEWGILPENFQVIVLSDIAAERKGWWTKRKE